MVVVQIRPEYRIREMIELPDRLAGERGDSGEQRDAETVMIELLSRRIGVALKPQHIDLPEGGRLELDGFSREPLVVCEAWAHQGEAKAAQKDKVAKDVLKLMFVSGILHAQPRSILLFSDEEAAKFLRGKSWRAQAMRSLEIEIHVVELPPDLRAKVVAAQRRQYR